MSLRMPDSVMHRHLSGGPARPLLGGITDLSIPTQCIAYL